MKVLTAAQMAALDRQAIEVLGIPGPVLMENAAIGAVDALGSHFPAAQEVTLVAGPGNNGGDGLAMARHLNGRGYCCRTFLALRAGPPAGDAALQLEILERAGIRVERLGPDDSLAPLAAACQQADVVVDALFGTGLRRPLSGHYAAIIELLGASGVPVLAVDVPSGLDATRAEPIGPHLQAELTVTFALPKRAHVLAPACDAMGVLAVVDLGLPAGLLESAEAGLELLEADELAALLAPRPGDAHKGACGHVLLVAGAAGTSGAAVLAARGAVRGGAGLVSVATPESVRDAVDRGSLESMTLGLATEVEAQSGELGLGEQAVRTLLAAAAGKAAAGIGPGLGQQSSTAASIRRLAAGLTLPLVLDADALNAHAGQLEALALRRAPTVLTPHAGEMARLLGMENAAAVQDDRLAAVQRAAARSRAVVVLKGRHSLIAAPDAPVAVCPTGNAGMATGGSGDVLTGLLTALLGQGLAARDAACLAVYVHGLAGDLAAEACGVRALIASDLLAQLGPAFGRLRPGA